MRRGGGVAPRVLLSVATWLCVILGSDVLAAPAAPYKPEGEMRWALYVTISPAWFDPAQVAVVGGTPFWFCYALHDALVKPMPDNPMAPSLAESWTLSGDQRVYEFKLREGLHVPQWRSLHRRRMSSSLSNATNAKHHAGKSPGGGGRRSLPGALSFAPAVARFHDLLWDPGHRGRLDRAQKVPRAGGR